MITKDFVKDIELYICEKFGYRNSVYVNPTCNGCCIDIREKDCGNTATASTAFLTVALSW